MNTKLSRKLAEIGKRIGDGGTVRVGFLENATYPAGAKKAGLHVATVAWWNNFGNVRIPARPFFTNMISTKSPAWGSDLRKIFVASQYNTKITLSLLGTRIKDQLVQSIVDWPADNAPATIARKGFNKGLIHQGVMQRSVDFEVA